MKKFYSLMLVAVAAMAFTACSQDDTQDVVKPEGATKTITVSAETDTRVTLNADHTKMQWVEGDVFSLFTDVDVDANKQLTFAEGTENFELTVGAAAAEVYAYYPYYDSNTDKTSVSLYVTSTQNQAVAGVLQGASDSDSGQYPMVAVATPIENNSVSLTFRPVACAFAFNIYGTVADGEQIKSVSFTPADEQVVAGAEYVDLTNLAADYKYTAANGYATTATVTLGTPFTPDTTKPADTQAYDKQVYLTVAAKAYAGGTFVVTTTETTYTFTTASTLDCTGKDFFPMNLNLAKGEKPAAVTLADGDYVVLFEKTNWLAMSLDKNGNRQQAVEFDYDGESASVTTNEEKIVWTLKGLGDNTYSIKSLSTDQYVSFYKSGVTLAAEERALTFTLNDDGVTYEVRDNVTDESDAATRGLTYNTGYGFGFYTTSTGAWTIRFVPATFTATPSMSVDEDSLNFGSEAGATGSVAVALKYLETSAVTVTCPDWLSYAWDGTTLNFTTLSANEDTENARTGEVVLSAGGVTPITIPVSQAMAGEDIELTFTTWSESISSYTSTWTQSCGGYDWGMVNFSNNQKGWSDARCGRSKYASVAQIATKFAIPWAVSEVVVTVSTVRKTDKLTSATLQVATDDAFSNIVETVSVATSSYNAKGDVTYTITTPTANCYYRLVYDMPSSGQNGHIGISKVVYVAQ